MKIAICDDEKMFCTQLDQMLHDFFVNTSIDIAIDIFNSGESFLKKNTAYDIIFLDYQMKGLNGLQTAYEIRRANSDCNIIFVTSFPSVAIEAYEVNTFRFLIKPIDARKFSKAMNDYLKLINSRAYVTINSEGCVYNILASSIVSLEAQDKGTVVTLDNGFYKTAESLKVMEAKLPDGMFFKTHRSYVVNFLHVRKYDKNEITLSNGQKAKISRLKSEAFDIGYLNCWDRYSV